MATVRKPRSKKTSESTESTPSKQTASVTSITTRSVDLQDAIRERAYELYKQRGGQHGADLEDWVQAEKEILERFRGRTA